MNGSFDYGQCCSKTRYIGYPIIIYGDIAQMDLTCLVFYGQKQCKSELD